MGVFNAHVTRKQPGVFTDIGKALERAVYDGLDNGGRVMEKAAKQNVNDGHSVSGTLADSITLSFPSSGGSIQVAAIRPAQIIQAYTLEFGATGVTHGSPWYVHESQTPYDLHAMYGFPVVKSKQGRFYEISYLKPHKYLSNAFESTNGTVVQEVGNSIRTVLNWYSV